MDNVTDIKIEEYSKNPVCPFLLTTTQMQTIDGKVIVKQEFSPCHTGDCFYYKKGRCEKV